MNSSLCHYNGIIRMTTFRFQAIIIVIVTNIILKEIQITKGFLSSYLRCNLLGNACDSLNSWMIRTA